MKNRKILAVLALGAVMAFAGACGSQKNAATQAQTVESTVVQTETAQASETAADQTAESVATEAASEGITGSVTGTIEELKDFMLIVNGENGVSYPIPFGTKPEGYDNLKVGDKVMVSFTGTLSEVDAFDGEITSIEVVK